MHYQILQAGVALDDDDEILYYGEWTPLRELWDKFPYVDLSYIRRPIKYYTPNHIIEKGHIDIDEEKK